MPKTAGMSFPPEVFAAWGGGSLWDCWGVWAEWNWNYLSHSSFPHIYFCGFKMLPQEIRKAQEDSAKRGGGGFKGKWNLHVSFLFTYHLSHCLLWSFSLPLSVATAVGVSKEGQFFLQRCHAVHTELGGLSQSQLAFLPQSQSTACLLAHPIVGRKMLKKKKTRRHRKAQPWMGC